MLAHGIGIYLHSTAAERECGGGSELTCVSACMAIYNKCQQLMLVGIALRLGEAQCQCLWALSLGGAWWNPAEDSLNNYSSSNSSDEGPDGQILLPAPARKIADIPPFPQ